MRFLAAMLALAAAAILHAAPAALIVVGLTANETDADQWQQLADQTRTGLLARGFAADHIATLSGGGTPVSRDAVLAALAKAKTAAGKDDPFWLVLLGHSAPGRDGLPAFQLRGPRLSAADLHDALAGFAGPTDVLLGSEFSTDYLPALKDLPNCTAVAASAGPMSPRFPQYWAEALAASPQADFAQLAATAADHVATYYTDQHLAQGETASLLAKQDIKEAPFTDTSTPPAAAMPPPAAPTIDAGDTAANFPPPTAVSGDQDYIVQPANDQTHAQLADARKQADDSGDYAAVILHQELDYTFNADRTSACTTRLRVFLRQPEAVDTWADYDFADEPPAETTVIESARVITPDGAVLLLNTDRINNQPRPAESDFAVPFHVHLPQVTAGCIVEIAWREEFHTLADLPETYDEFPLAHDVPTLDTELTLRTPKDVAIYHQFRQLPDAPAPAESATEHSTVLTWHLPTLPAWEPLPNDPPVRDLVPMLAVSSLVSWDAFAAWFHRLTQGTFDAGPATRALAAKISAEHATPADRLRAAYEDVSALRYEAIEIGINGFRPRPPDTVLANHYGDCKDKATLLSALLRAMDIPAEFALVNRGSSTDTSFPGWQFNHALVHVPASDGIPEQWLDATDGTTPPGYVGPGDIGRNALVFSGDQAHFLTITDLKKATSVTDTWALTQQADGAWTGQLDRQFTGLADEEIRDELRPLSPAQRTVWLLTHFACLCPGAEYSTPTVSDLSNLSEPVAVHAEVRLPASTQPYGPDHPVPLAPTFLPGLSLADELAAPDRNRPFLVNDGQPLRYEQHVRLVFNQAVTMPAATDPSASNPHVAGAIAFARPDDHTVDRTATLAIAAPTVPAADYAAFRRAILDWQAALATPISHP